MNLGYLSADINCAPLAEICQRHRVDTECIKNRAKIYFPFEGAGISVDGEGLPKGSSIALWLADWLGKSRKKNFREAAAEIRQNAQLIDQNVVEAHLIVHQNDMRDAASNSHYEETRTDNKFAQVVGTNAWHWYNLWMDIDHSKFVRFLDKTSLGIEAYSPMEYPLSLFLAEGWAEATNLADSKKFFLRRMMDFYGKRAFPVVEGTVPEKPLDFVIDGDVLVSYTGRNADVEIPPCVRVIADKAFMNCDHVRNVIVNNENIQFGTKGIVNSRIFWGCDSLADEQGFVIVNNCLFDYVGNEKNVVIPRNVTHIASECFSRGYASFVQIHSGVIDIGNNAFGHNMTVCFEGSVPNLRNRWMQNPRERRTMGPRYGEYWIHYETPTKQWRNGYKDGMYIVGDCLVYCATEGSDLMIPDGVRSIAKWAFSGNYRSITLPEGTEYIAPYAISTGNVKKLYLPSTIKKIEMRPREKTEIYLAEDSVEIEQVIADFAQTKYILKKAKTTTKKTENETGPYVVGRMKDGGVRIKEYVGPYDETMNLIIPETINGKPVKAIGKKAFAKKAFASISLPDTVEYIEAEAFAGTKLDRIRLSANLKDIGANAFTWDFSFVDLPESLEEIHFSGLNSRTMVMRSDTKLQNIDVTTIYADGESARAYAESVQTWRVKVRSISELDSRYEEYRLCGVRIADEKGKALDLTLSEEK